MRSARFPVLAGVAALALASFVPIARAQAPQTHVMTLRLPDGQVEQIRYVGDAPPIVTLAPDTAAFAAFDPWSQFSAMDRMMAAMDRQAAAMLQAVNAMAAPDAAGFGLVPAMSGPGVCMHSVQITMLGNGQPPRVVSHSAGDCGPVRGQQTTPATLPNVPDQHQSPRLIEAKAATPYRNLVRPVSDWQR